jgi:hypothetical protein
MRQSKIIVVEVWKKPVRCIWSIARGLTQINADKTIVVALRSSGFIGGQIEAAVRSE